MSKVIRGTLLLGVPLLLLIYCNLSYAEGSLFGHGEEDEVLSLVTNTSGYIDTISPVNNRILGYTVTGSAAAIVGIYDYNGFITEGGCLAGDMKTVWFPFPKKINGRLEVLVNASTTVVTIYYE